MEKYNDRRESRPEVCETRGSAWVVDQDWQDVQGYAGVLRHLGFDVEPFTNYQEASRRLEEESPDFVFVNQGTAAFEAREVLMGALARSHRTPVVVLTRSLNMGCYLEAMQLGAADYVEVPLTPAEVEHLVTTHLQPRALKARTTARP
ncbi:MAG TPA: response regulator [Terriglobia bacterium]|nr:response regulator [Terriglobia bacterium]